jgi:hypothetical protein
MKSFLRIGCEFLRLCLLVGTLGAGAGIAQAPPTPPKRSPAPAAGFLRAVRVTSGREGPAVEIITSSSLTTGPTIQTLESPPRLVIDLPNTQFLLPRKPLDGDSVQVTRIRINQSQNSPPVTRIVVDLVHPVGYSTDSQGEHLLLHLHPLAEARQ